MTTISTNQPVTKIPAIDFSKEDCLKPGTSSWLSVRKEVCHTLEEFGCFVAILPNNVLLELSNTIFGTMNELFNFPMEIKAQTPKETPVVDGHYIAGNAAHESLSFGTQTEKTWKFTHHFWPNGNDQFRESVDLYAKAMAELNETVTRMVFESYNVTKYHDDHIQASTISNFRFTKYKEPKKTGTEAGLPAHTDKTFNTILHQNHVNGLEIYTKDNHWIGFDPDLPASFVFLAGDGLEVWSNGRIPSCKHRVNMRDNEVRYSVGVFFFNEGVIHTPKELTNKIPIQYKPLHQLEFLQYYLENNVSLGVDYTVKKYCGV